MLALAACALLMIAGTPVAGTPAREEASISFHEAIAEYGPGLFPAMTQLARCGDFRVFVVYGNGTDMLFMDRLVPAANESTFAAVDGMSFAEFNTYEESRTVETLTCKLLEAGKLQIAGQAHSSHDDKSFRFTFVVDTVNRSYEYQETPTK